MAKLVQSIPIGLDIKYVTCSPNGRIVVIEEDRRYFTRIYQLTDDKSMLLIRRFKLKSDDFMPTYVFSPASTKLAFGTTKGYIWLIDTTTWVMKRTPQYGNDPITYIVFSPDGTKLAWGTNRGDIYLWDIITQKLVYRLNYQPAEITCLQFMDRDDTLISADCSANIIFWNTQNGTYFKKFNLDSRVTFAKISPSGDYVVTHHMFTSIFDLDDGQLIGELDDIIGTIFMPNGQLLMVQPKNDYSGRLYFGLVDVATQTVVQKLNYRPYIPDNTQYLLLRRYREGQYICDLEMWQINIKRCATKASRT